MILKKRLPLRVPSASAVAVVARLLTQGHPSLAVESRSWPASSGLLRLRVDSSAAAAHAPQPENAAAQRGGTQEEAVLQIQLGFVFSDIMLLHTDFVFSDIM